LDKQKNETVFVQQNLSCGDESICYVCNQLLTSD